MSVSITNVPVYVIPNISNIFSGKKTQYKYFTNVNSINVDYLYDNSITELLNLTKLYLDCLIQLRGGVSCPFILLENDTRMFDDNNIDNISYPEDADAVYLGIINHGFDNILANYIESHGRDTILAQYIPTNNIYRIYNMLGMYAILYNSMDYVERSIYAIQYMLDLKLHGSRGLASIMKYYNVYALNKSIFYHRMIPDTKINISECKIRNIFY